MEFTGRQELILICALQNYRFMFHEAIHTSEDKNMHIFLEYIDHIDSLIDMLCESIDSEYDY